MPSIRSRFQSPLPPKPWLDWTVEIRSVGICGSSPMKGLDVFLDQPRDRELFDLAPKEVSKNEAIED